MGPTLKGPVCGCLYVVVFDGFGSLLALVPQSSGACPAVCWLMFGSLLALVRQLFGSCRPALVPIQAASRALRGDCSCPPPSFFFLFTLQRYEIIFNLPNIYAIIFVYFS